MQNTTPSFFYMLCNKKMEREQENRMRVRQKVLAETKKELRIVYQHKREYLFHVGKGGDVRHASTL